MGLSKAASFCDSLKEFCLAEHEQKEFASIRKYSCMNRLLTLLSLNISLLSPCLLYQQNDSNSLEFICTCMRVLLCTHDDISSTLKNGELHFKQLRFKLPVFILLSFFSYILKLGMNRLQINKLQGLRIGLNFSSKDNYTGHVRYSEQIFNNIHQSKDFISLNRFFLVDCVLGALSSKADSSFG